MHKTESVLVYLHLQILDKEQVHYIYPTVSFRLLKRFIKLTPSLKSEAPIFQTSPQMKSHFLFSHFLHIHIFFLILFPALVSSLSCDSNSPTICADAFGFLSQCIFLSAPTQTDPAKGYCSASDGSNTPAEGNGNASGNGNGNASNAGNAEESQLSGLSTLVRNHIYNFETN